MPELYLLYAAVCIAFALASLLVCFIWSRVLGQASGYGFWAASLITMPVLSVMYGVYSIVSYEGCPSDANFAFWCMSESEHLLFVGWVNFLLIPIFCLCISIPATMWFVGRRNWL